MPSHDPAQHQVGTDVMLGQHQPAPAPGWVMRAQGSAAAFRNNIGPPKNYSADFGKCHSGWAESLWKGELKPVISSDVLVLGLGAGMH